MSLPAKPQGFAAAAAAGGVTLSWKANPAGDGVVAYQVYRTPTAWFSPALVAATGATACVDASAVLLPGTQWAYFIVAVNAGGISPLAEAAPITIKSVSTKPVPLPLSGRLYARAQIGAPAGTKRPTIPPPAKGNRIAAVRVANYGFAKVA